MSVPTARHFKLKHRREDKAKVMNNFWFMIYDLWIILKDNKILSVGLKAHGYLHFVHLVFQTLSDDYIISGWTIWCLRLKYLMFAREVFVV